MDFGAAGHHRTEADTRFREFLQTRCELRQPVAAGGIGQVSIFMEQIARPRHHPPTLTPEICLERAQNRQTVSLRLDWANIVH